MAEPTTQDRVNALAVLAATFKRSTWSTNETEPIAKALASARAGGVKEGLEKAAATLEARSGSLQKFGTEGRKRELLRASVAIRALKDQPDGK